MNKEIDGTEYACITINAFLEEENNKLKQRIAELETKLAEKEKEIKCLKIDLGMYKSVNEFINNYGIEKAREVLLQSEKTKKQDKIEFAVEQLEFIKTQCEFIISFADDEQEERLFDIIDSQIAGLKGGLS